MRKTLNTLLDAYESISDPQIRERLETLIRDTIACHFSPMRMNTTEIDTAMHTGKIAAIKLVRTRLNIGLKEAKDLVESEQQRLGFTFYHYG